MNIQSILKRILAMIGIGIVLVLIFYAIGYHIMPSVTDVTPKSWTVNIIKRQL